MDQAEIMQIALVERQAQELEGHLQIVDSQIIELDSFMKTLEELISTKEKEMLSSLGKRVYIKTKIEDAEKLFVEVGAGIVVKKTPHETLDVVKAQIKRLKEVRMEISGQLQFYHKELEDFLKKVRN